MDYGFSDKIGKPRLNIIGNSSCGDLGMMKPDKKHMNEITIRPTELYSVSNVMLDFANRRLNGIVKKYMEKQMYSQSKLAPVNQVWRYAIPDSRYLHLRNDGSAALEYSSLSG